MSPRLGLLLPMFGGWEGSTNLGEPSIDYPYLERCTVEAEALGFDSVWLPDHFCNPLRDPGFGGLEAWTTASALARVTSRIRLSFATLSAGFRGPGLVAKMGATLDRISKGRLILTMGAGWFREEYKSFGIPWASHEERVQRAREQMDVIRKLWTKSHVTFRGRYYRTRDATLEPKPLQRPTPPIWYGGESLASMRAAAQSADGWLFGDCSLSEVSARVKAFRKLTRRPLPTGMMIGIWPRKTSCRDVNGASGSFTFLSGDAAEVAEGIVQLSKGGLSLLLLKFHPTLKGLHRFAKDVLPCL